MLASNLKGDKICPECGGAAFVDTWKPPPGYDPGMRKFICADCGLEFYVTIKDPEVLIKYDLQLGRK